MKKVLLVAVGALLMTVTANAQKFGHFNSADIIQILPEYKAAQTELKTLQEQYEKDLQSMQEELERKYKDYELRKDSLPENIRQRRENELTDLNKRIQQTYQDNSAELQKASNEKMEAISTKIKNAVKEIGDTGGYVYIMDLTGGVPYISTTLSIDITNELRTKLGLK
ncbi:MAG: OmpH family outer membrane protein [Prevotellaceae bacterium]|nr:OmpH family outer membrane protein [Candidatus Faecinaster equi]